MYYYCCPGCHQPYYSGPYMPLRQFPSVDPELFFQSANETQKLMDDAGIVLERLAASKEFDEELMIAAQESDKEKVEQLIHSIEFQSDVEVNFNPDNLRLEFRSQLEGTECCRLLIALRWG